MSSILHFDNVLINPSWLQCSDTWKSVCVCVCVHCGSVSSCRDGPSLRFVSLQRNTGRSLVHIPFCLYHTVHSRSWYSFSAQVPSPQTLAIQTCRHSHGGFVMIWKKKNSLASERRENERTSFLFTNWIPQKLSSFILWILLYTETGKCSLRHNDDLSRWKMNTARWLRGN